MTAPVARGKVEEVLRRIALGSLVVVCWLVASSGAASAADRGNVDIDVVNADIRNVLRLFADVGHVNLVLGDDVSGVVTVRLKNVPWETALRSTLAVKGLDMERTGNVVRVATAEALAKERAVRLSARQTCLETAPLVTRILRLSYADAEAIANLIRPSLTKRGSVSVDTRTNTVIVRDVSCD
jgi:type IV pilus assembly protein PilQ